MKTNKLKYMACSGVLLLLTVFATVSCDDANDWGTDSSYNQLYVGTRKVKNICR